MDSSGCTALDGLVARLEEEFSRDPKGSGAAAILADYASTHDDWRSWIRWSEERYTRNLIARTEAFELLLLGWGAGQESPIHNHEGQNCWMAVLDGEIEELQYAFPPDPPVPDTPLEALGGRIFERGGVAFIRDEIALHLVRGAQGRAGVSLHLYSKPYAACNVYCPRTGKVERVELSYHSIRGELVSAASE